MLKYIKQSIKGNIARAFFFNYSVLFVILSITMYGTFLATEQRIERRYEEKEFVQLEELFEDYLAHGIETAVNNSIVAIEYMEYITEDLVVKDAYNSPHTTGYAYSFEELEALEDQYYEVVFYYPYASKDDFLLIYAPEFFAPPDVSDIVIGAITLYVLFLMSVIFFYTRMTSRKIIVPVQHLNQAVDQISRGNYQPSIPFDTENELGHLKNAILHMAEKINAGITYRQQAEKSRKQLLLNISHDLKTPLTNIRGYAETISTKKELHPEALSTYIDIIKSNSIRADLLIQDLFELSKMESSDLELNLAPFNICEDLRRMIILHVPELENQNMTYEIDIPNEKIWVQGDQLRLDRAISNLIINSIRYSGNGTHLKIRVRPINHHVEICIEDNGIGIPHELENVLFDPFIKADPSRRVNDTGSGLGLAITKSIVEKHEGTIELDRSYEDGCRYVILLPMAK